MKSAWSSFEQDCSIMQKGQDMKKIGIAYLIIISLLAVIFLIADYKGAVTGDDIQENISSSAHIIRSEDISSSKVVLFRETGKIKYTQYDKLPAGDLYHQERTGELKGDDIIVLSSGWHAYIVRISETDITVLSVDKWKGDRTRILSMFILVSIIAILTVAAAAAVKHYRR